ncbi:MAG TPA: hypothetical protein VIH22_09410 [Cyclobacteriaceae bacterium]
MSNFLLVRDVSLLRDAEFDNPMAQLHGKTVNLAQPRWQQLLGCLGGLTAIVFMALYALAGCTQKPKADGSVVILAPGQKTADRSIHFAQVRKKLDAIDHARPD